MTKQLAMSTHYGDLELLMITIKRKLLYNSSKQKKHVSNSFVTYLMQTGIDNLIRHQFQVISNL